MKNSADFSRALDRGERVARRRAARLAEMLAAQPLPPGVVAEVVDEGVRLSGRRLTLRIVRDPELVRIRP